MPRKKKDKRSDLGSIPTAPTAKTSKPVVSQEYLSVVSVPFSKRKLGRMFKRIPELIAVNDINKADLESLLEDRDFVVTRVIK